MPEGSGPETSRWATWCFGCDKTPEGGTSSRPPWEGPFVIAKVLKPGMYKLANSQGEVYGNLEHPTATSLLPLRCFQVVHIPRTHAKFSHQGRVGLASAKPDPPSGAKRGGTPSASKFSSKKDLFCQNVFRAF
jgi:hypothetical protein